MTRIETLIKNFPANADAALITSGENLFFRFSFISRSYISYEGYSLFNSRFQIR